MKYLFFSLIMLFLVSVWATPLSAQMNNKKLEKIIKQEAEDVGGETGAWHLYIKDRVLLIVTDEKNNRMRIFTPVVEETEIDAKEMHKMLVANFHSALDAKYSIYEGFVISTFTHPLKELTENQLRDAMHQVINLAETFGSSYSSTELFFGGATEDENKADEGVQPAQGKKS